MFVETPGRKFDQHLMWSVLSNVTTELRPNTADVSSAEELVEDTQLSQLTEELTDTTTDASEGPLNNSMFSHTQQRSSGVDNLASMDAGLNAELEMLDREGDDSEETIDDEVLLDSTETTELDEARDDGNTSNENDIDIDRNVDCNKAVEVMVGKKRTKNVWKAAIHINATNDTFASGKMLLENKKLVQTRLPKRQREKQEQLSLQDDLYTFLTEMSGEVPALVAKLENANVIQQSPDAQEANHHRLARRLQQM